MFDRYGGMSGGQGAPSGNMFGMQQPGMGQMKSFAQMNNPGGGFQPPMGGGNMGGDMAPKPAGGGEMNWGMAMMQSPTSPYNMQQNLRDLQAQLQNAQIMGANPLEIADLQRRYGWAQQDMSNMANQQMGRFAQQHSGPMVGGGYNQPDPYLMQIMRAQWGMGPSQYGGSAAGMHGVGANGMGF